MLPHCILAAHKGREGLDVATLNPRTDEARGWLAKRAGRKVYAVTAQTSGPLRGRAISESDIVQTRIVGVAIPAARRAVLDSFRPAPSIIGETPRGFAIAWRLCNPATPDKARELASRIAANLGGVALDFLFPLPGCGDVWLLQHLKGPEHWVLVTAFDGIGQTNRSGEAASELLFVSAATVEMAPVDWLWPDMIACGDFTLLGGAPGMGKSQITVFAAATVSRGGLWPDGSRAERGSVILCETEDRLKSALRPRLEAAGADLSRIAFGKHMDLSTGMNALAEQAEQMPDLRLLVLSPVLTFFGPTSTPTSRCAPRSGRCSNGPRHATSRCWSSFTRSSRARRTCSRAATPSAGPPAQPGGASSIRLTMNPSKSASSD